MSIDENLEHVDFQPRSSITSLALSNVDSDLIIKARIKYGNRCSAYKALMAEYSKSSSIHGIRYIFEIHRPFYEKLFWLMLLIMSLFLSIYLMWNTYVKWSDSPVILVFDETLMPVSNIPFPTITICPEIKVEAEQFNFAEVSKQIWMEIEENQKFENSRNITEENLQNFLATLQTCDKEVIDQFFPYISKYQTVDIIQNLADMAIDVNSTLLFCKWNGRFYFCSDLMKHVLTDEGICYQFNGLKTEDIYRDSSFVQFSDNKNIDFNKMFDAFLPKYENVTGNWSLDNGYVNQGLNAYPQRSVYSSARNGLFAMMMGLEHNFDYTCRGFKQGYKIFLNSPESVPLTTGNYILVPHDHEVLVSVFPQYITSTQDLHSVEPDKRQCYFNDERYLSFFKTYSQSNCQTECLVNFTIAKCGCAKYWMPKPSNIPTCDLADVACYNTAADEMTILITEQTARKMIDHSSKIMCDCMPSCVSLDYNFEISRSYYDYERTLEARREPYEHDDGRGARLSVYFKETQFTPIQRRIIFGYTTLIANFGGIFGLFMGFSSLSIIELIYFFSVRLCNNLYRRRRIHKRLLQLNMDE